MPVTPRQVPCTYYKRLQVPPSLSILHAVCSLGGAWWDLIINNLTPIAAFYINLHTSPQYGMTPLILATKAKNEEIISILLNAGADLDLQTEDVSDINFKIVVHV